MDSAGTKTKTVPDVIVITGMSGAGKTVAMHTLEDLGYYVIDNLPPSLILDLARLVGQGQGVHRHLAVACDARSNGIEHQLETALQSLSAHELTYSLLFLDASDEVLRRRYSQLRRRHPLAAPGEPVLAAIQRERELLEPVRAQADHVLDTSTMYTSQLRAKLHGYYSELSDQQLLEVHVFSFGFRYGMPAEADLLIDVRFLPNPYYDPNLRELTGLDDPVADFVLEHPQTRAFLDAWRQLLATVMPGYVSEGKPQLSIGVGCTGGQHRSVVLALQTAAFLKGEGYHVSLSHRDLARAEF